MGLHFPFLLKKLKIVVEPPPCSSIKLELCISKIPVQVATGMKWYTVAVTF
jgi:hypothetical protein